MPIRGIVFDAAGTLIYPEPSAVDVYRQVGLQFGVDLAHTEIQQRFGQNFKRFFQNPNHWDQPTNEAIERHRWRQVVQAVFPEARHADALFETLWQHFAVAQHWRVYDDVFDCWNWLQTQAYVVAIGSNFDRRLHQLLPQLQPLDQITQVFCSADLGWSKPSERFFDELAQRLEIAPEQLLMIGDHLTNDCHGPRRAGWKSLFLSRSESPSQTVRDRSLPTEATLVTLRDLPRCLANTPEIELSKPIDNPID